MSTDQHLTDQVYAAVQALAADKPSFLPGDLASHLRTQGQPMGVWQLRGELSRLEDAGLLRNDPVSGAWSLAEAASRQVG